MWLIYNKCLMLRTPKTLECHMCELSYEFLHNLHHGQVINEETYMQKMSIYATNHGF
jgi:hypothetical protein